MSQLANISLGAGGGTISASASSISLGQVVFSNSNNVSFGLNGSTMTAVVNGVAGTVSASASSISLGQVVFSNSNNVSFGLSGSTVTGSIPVVYFEKFPLYTPAGTLVAGNARYSGSTTTTAGGSVTVLSIYIEPYPIPYNLTFNRVWQFARQIFTSGTWSQTMNQMLGLYTDNAGTLSLLSTWNAGAVISQNSATAISIQWWWGTNSTSNSSSLSGNLSTFFTSYNNIVVGTGANSLSSGNYWYAAVDSNVTAGAATTLAARRGYVMAANASGQNIGQGSMFGASALTDMDIFWGVVSTTLTSNAASISGLLPAAINATDINHTFLNPYASSWQGLLFAST